MGNHRGKTGAGELDPCQHAPVQGQQKVEWLAQLFGG